ncbi:hypothetical protein I2I11_02640 [Pontibacter sp. 172403-2]|uniref:hypothetical protein n=1 Tax=Pontibacter rufus TaxID=2791028 RepID=UPI0018AFC5AB|nr:hypothetical protein [Pontibacter sp. 172403-2]MBF9252181.1 hypothetical protein [Pontibacter sp. 172403-2]
MTCRPDKRITVWRSRYVLCGYVLVIGFLLNLIWENAQAPFYRGYNGFFAHFWICFIAAVVDALVLLLLYLLFAVLSHSLYWPLKAKLWQYGLLAFSGGLLALWFEKWALAKEQWSYTTAMPLVPVLDVGLLPLLQLMLLPGLAFYLGANAAKPRL